MAIVVTVIAYLIGSISFAVVVSRVMGLPDPRSYGSKNPGATNVLRSGKKVAAGLTLLGDGAKGWLAVFLTDAIFATAVPPVYKMSLVAVAVVIGHMYPVFHRFRGGKGVSTALGVLLALNGWLAAGTVATWVIIAFFFRISSLAALISALFAPFFCYLLYGVHPFTAAVGVISLLLIWRHKTNIRNLLAGTEERIGTKRV
ncbi:MAG: glycerol-3-phosphate 1-O-acyltransferase PlsY [Betaproteobacteria bacterium]|nr:glycerol-3-phosphate 1-O-acyltransferase PlsY [Betaproteobacteria bacterium]